MRQLCWLGLMFNLLGLIISPDKTTSGLLLGSSIVYVMALIATTEADDDHLP